MAEVCTLVTPETVLRWYRTLIARKYDAKLWPRRGLAAAEKGQEYCPLFQLSFRKVAIYYWECLR